jgi:hypothetical protein
MQTTLIKKKTKLSSYKRLIRWDREHSHIYEDEEGLPNTVYEEMRKYLVIYEEVTGSHI